MDRKLKIMIDNCIRVMPVKGIYNMRDLKEELKEQDIYAVDYVDIQKIPITEISECINERGESEVNPAYIDCDESIEEIEWSYYRYEKGGKVACF